MTEQVNAISERIKMLFMCDSIRYYNVETEPVSSL